VSEPPNPSRPPDEALTPAPAAPRSWLQRLGPPPGPLPPRTIWTARALAAGADLTQFFLFPLFGEGAVSPLNVGLDLVLCAVMTRLVGFHWAFAPTFAAELVPVLDLAPTWTAAVLLATTGKRKVVE
jgi:hypothetical protein